MVLIILRISGKIMNLRYVLDSNCTDFIGNFNILIPISMPFRLELGKAGAVMVSETSGFDYYKCKVFYLMILNENIAFILKLIDYLITLKQPILG